MAGVSPIHRAGLFALVAVFFAVWLAVSQADAESASKPVLKPTVDVTSWGASESVSKKVVSPAPKVASEPASKKASKPKKSPKAKKPKIKLFGTVEFKGKIRKLPKWTRVLDKMQAWEGYFKSPAMAKLPSKSGWNKLKKETRPMDSMGRLKATNKFFNQWPYRLDAANYGRSDYWAIPLEFLKKSGDCEDYAIAKFYALQELGFSSDMMRVVAIKDAIRGIGHAVLVVYLENEAYVLDNQTNMVLPHSRYKHYVPQYSVNEKYRWMHVPVMKKKK
jgi:predicted transglutaminase-like cysteine proteinase